jgi:hypothetical protein
MVIVVVRGLAAPECFCPAHADARAEVGHLVLGEASLPRAVDELHELAPARRHRADVAFWQARAAELADVEGAHLLAT